MLVCTYAPHNAGQSDCFRRLMSFLGTTCTLMLLGDVNTIHDACMYCVSSKANRVGNPRLRDLLRKIQIADRLGANTPNAPQWTWVNRDGSCRSCVDKIFVRIRDKRNYRCLQF